jgi:hypothetical protein
MRLFHFLTNKIKYSRTTRSSTAGCASASSITPIQKHHQVVGILTVALSAPPSWRSRSSDSGIGFLNADLSDLVVLGCNARLTRPAGNGLCTCAVVGILTVRSLSRMFPVAGCIPIKENDADIHLLRRLPAKLSRSPSLSTASAGPALGADHGDLTLALRLTPLSQSQVAATIC